MSDPHFVVQPAADRPLAAHRQALIRAVLINEIALVQKKGRSDRRRNLVAAGVLAAALVGATGAVAYHQMTQVTDTSSATCFATASYPGSVQSYTTLAKSGPTGTLPIDGAIDACSAMWRGGFFQIGTPTLITDQIQGRDYPIPALSDCILPTGQNGVFPGGSGTCQQLGFVTVSVSAAH